MYCYDHGHALALAARWASEGYPAVIEVCEKPWWQQNSPSHPNAHGYVVNHI